MTEQQQKQYDRFIEVGYEPGLAQALIQRGAWLEILGEQEATRDDIRRYCEEVAARAVGMEKPDEG